MSEQQVVLVTGSSSGFGRLTVEALVRRGHLVAATLRDPDGRNRAAADGLRALGDGVRVLALDVGDDASVERGVGEALAAFGRIDAVVNNAGVGQQGILETVTPEQLARQLDVNVAGPLRVDRAVLPHLRERRAGVLVHVSSGAGRLVLPFSGAYTASKFALEALAETLRYELAPLGVDSVIVEPGAYATDFMANGRALGVGEDDGRSAAYGALRDAQEQFFSGPPEGAGDPAEVAEAIADLVETPTGRRPLRTLVGSQTDAVRPINDLTDEIQREMLGAMGLDALLATTPAAPGEARTGSASRS